MKPPFDSQLHEDPVMKNKSRIFLAKVKKRLAASHMKQIIVTIQITEQFIPSEWLFSHVSTSYEYYVQQDYEHLQNNIK